MSDKYKMHDERNACFVTLTVELSRVTDARHLGHFLPHRHIGHNRISMCSTVPIVVKNISSS
jgi:hypothetical protein